MAPSAKPTLYSYFRSTCSWRVRIALALKGIEYESTPVHLVKDGGQQNKEEYRFVNPVGVLPSIVIDGNTISESMAIMEYLEETRPLPPIMPSIAIDRAKVRQIAMVIVSGIQPIQNLRVLQKIGDTKVEWANHWITQGFIALEELLKSTSGKYCFGDEVTIADCCLVPQIYNANRYNVDMTKFPTIVRIAAALDELEAFKVSHPSKQSDCPEELRA